MADDTKIYYFLLSSWQVAHHPSCQSVIDQGSEYDMAVEQSIYYNHGLEEIDEIILNITIATRYSECGENIRAIQKKVGNYYI